MKRTNEDLNLIHILIKKHIENISGSGISKQDKEIDYLLISEALEALVREYKKSDDSRQRQYIKKIIIEVDKELFTYLININSYDHKILELYVMLEELINN